MILLFGNSDITRIKRRAGLAVPGTLSAGPESAAGVVSLSVDSALCSPAGIGGSRILSGTLLFGQGSASASSCPGEVGGGGGSSVSAAPLRIAGGGSAAAAELLSIDGTRFVGALSQSMPMTALSGSRALSSPLALSTPSAIAAPYSVSIAIDGRDVTRQISECSIVSSESALFDTLTLAMPDGSAWPLDNPPAEVVVILPDAVHVFMVEEFGGDGPARTIWGRPLSARYASPWSSSAVWSENTSAAATAAELAAEIAGPIWTAADFPLPLRWEIDGTPAEALQKLAAAAGGVAIGASDSAGITIRKRWPVRPVDMTGASLVINRETALDINIDPVDTPGYGSVIVYGWSPDAMLPKFAIEGNPVLGQPAYLRLYWQGEDHPAAGDWITDGSATLLGRVAETVTETVVFTDGQAAVAWPIWDFLEFEWLGDDFGDIVWLENGYSTDLELASPGYGVALVTYRTVYERWVLSGQAADTVLFGVDVSQGAFSANIQLASGGPSAGEVKEPLLGSLPACVVHGTALLDDSRARQTAKATLPRLGHIATGISARVEDELAGLAGFGKVVFVETKITPSRITQDVEVALC